MTTHHQHDDDLNQEPDDSADEVAPEHHKPSFLEKVKDMFDPSDGSEPPVGKHTMEDWEVSTLESGADQGPH